ncbi:zinc-ribbon domain-containing protein [Thalassoglobus sp. JC818]|uniref:zinc-ribbon domain-containing protein n=1 Tax=Thalassoglobus sp. JC818 TaxID=3232136 RepID=UPI003459511E
MAKSFTVTCSQCGASLNLKDESRLGSKVRCPKCREVFVAKLSSSTADDEEWDDGGFFDDSSDEGFDDEWEDYGTPIHSVKSSKSKSASKKSSGKKSKKGKGKKRDSDKLPVGVIVAIFAGGLLMISLIGGALYLAATSLGAVDEARFAWLPSDMESYVELQVDDVWKSAVLRPVRSSEFWRTLETRLRTLSGVEIDQIDSIVVGTSATETTPIVLVRTKAPIDPSTMKGEVTPSTYAGKTIFDHADGFSRMVADEQTLVVGQRQMIEKSIDANGVCAVAGQFAFLPSYGHLIMGSISPDANFGADPSQFLSEDISIDSESVLNTLLVFNFRSDITAKFTVDFGDAASAQEAVEEGEEGIRLAKEALEAHKQDLENMAFVLTVQARSFVYKMEDVLDSISLSSSGSQFYGDFSINSGITRDFASEIEFFTPMLVRRVDSVLGIEMDEDEYDDEDDFWEDEPDDMALPGGIPLP